jgi:signal transduction histidine kinase
VPLTLDSNRFGELERIGTLQIHMGAKDGVDSDTALLIEAFSSHLAIVVSRIRAVTRAVLLNDEVMASSRFVAAEALAGISIHQAKHTLGITLARLNAAAVRKEVRERREVLETVEACVRQINDSFETVDNTLKLVKAPTNIIKKTQVHEAIQLAITNWMALLSQKKCGVRKRFEAARSICKISPNAFRELISVLIVNSVQAHARNIDIKTEAVTDFDRPGTNLFLTDGLLITFSDDGQGFPTDQTEQLFAPHYTTKPENEGTGLGLYIARELARRVAGDVWAERGEGKGATVKIALSLSQGDKNE